MQQIRILEQKEHNIERLKQIVIEQAVIVENRRSIIESSKKGVSFVEHFNNYTEVKAKTRSSEVVRNVEPPSGMNIRARMSSLSKSKHVRASGQ